MKKRTVLLGIIVFLASMIVGLIVAYLIKDKVVSYFKGYGIETSKKGDELTVKRDSSEWTVKILPKDLSLEQEFAVEIWKDILNVRVSEKDEHLEKIKAKEVIRLHIEVLAARIKTGKRDFKDVLVSNKDIKKALSLLNSAQNSIITISSS